MQAASQQIAQSRHIRAQIACRQWSHIPTGRTVEHHVFYCPWRSQRFASLSRTVLVGSNLQKVALQTLEATEQQVQIQVPGNTHGTSLFIYDGVIFDMDGTLTEAHIDFADMRARTGIPMGDLFTVLESWTDESAIKRAMDTILEIEAEAAARVSAKEGLFEILKLLKDKNVRVALVTRNTRASVQAFLDLIGPEWASLFSILLTREFSFVKPDKRLLQHISKEWGVPASRLLMVGDSLEDVEVGNAAGTATCLVAGGGNEKPGAGPTIPPPGAVATFTVSGLPQLAEQLEAASQAAATRARRIAALDHAMLMPPAEASFTEDEYDSASQLISLGLVKEEEVPSAVQPAIAAVVTTQEAVILPALDADDLPKPLSGKLGLGWPDRVEAGEIVNHEGAPPPGLDFLDWLTDVGALKPGACSFPVIGRAAGGLATCSVQEQGDHVLHVCCGAGGLTKILASQGMKVMGVDVDVGVAQRRGLHAVPFTAGLQPLTCHSMQNIMATVNQQPFDVLLLCATGSDSEEVPNNWWSAESLTEMRGLLNTNGRLCAQVSLVPPSHSHLNHKQHSLRSLNRSYVNPAVIINSINSCGMTVVAWQLIRPAPGCEATQLRLVARQHTHSEQADAL